MDTQVINRDQVLQKAIADPLAYRRQREAEEPLSLFEFMVAFWSEITDDEFKPNWHIEYLCKQLEEIAYQVADKKPKDHDLIINIPPGTTKTITCSIMFPVWCWTRWYWMRFITASYSAALALESAEKSRDMIRSEKFQKIYPLLDIKDDKDTKSNFRVIKKEYYFTNHAPRIKYGGNRYSTSVGGTLTGYHGHILIVDDPLNPEEAASEKGLENANRWMDQTLPTRKTDKAVTATIIVMQRLHHDDPTGHLLEKKKEKLMHICLPGELGEYEKLVKPQSLIKNYKDGLLDPVRLDREVLHELYADLGQYGYAGQIGQNPTPPGGGMFKVDHLAVLDRMTSETNIVHRIRYWDKAGTKGGGAYTAGVLIWKMENGKFIIADVRRGQWGTDEREDIIKSTAEADGRATEIYIEQEPGSGGKESAEATIKNLAGFACYRDLPTGDKARRADPFSVQVNWGNVIMLRAEWNKPFKDELEMFPNGRFKDQVDASSACFLLMTSKREVRVLNKRR